MSWYQDLGKAKASTPGIFRSASAAALSVRDADVSQRMIILPTRGLRAPQLAATRAAVRPWLQSLTVGMTVRHRAAEGGAVARVKVVDAVREDGAKLVEMTPNEVTALRAVQPGLRVVPELFYQPAVQVPFTEQRPAATGRGTQSVRITLRSQADGSPVGDVMVVAFTDFAARAGAEGVTSASGSVTLTLPSGTKRIERLYASPEIGFWGRLRRNVPVAPAIELRLAPIDLGYVDCVRYFCGPTNPTDGKRVKVAIIDSGIALNHPDLTVAGGECTITGEKSTDYGPKGGPHGTHVAGIVAAHGTPSAGIRGIAPAAELYSLRVFNPGEGASNFWIIKAIDRAVAMGCDLINMSLGGGPRDAALESAIGDAYLAGSVCIVASGNDDRQPVSVPAAFQLSVAVSAMGRKGTFPAGGPESGDVARPYGSDKKNFLAAFSNIGPELDVTGPGVGVISSVPGGYGVMSGTSMACPAVTGMAARLLSLPANTGILSAARDESRTNAIVQLLLQSCKKLGFGPTFEGLGLPR